MRWAVCVVLGLFAGACEPLGGEPYYQTCGGSSTYCEGDLVRSCTASCPEETLSNCEVVYSTTANCAVVTETTGIEKVCGELMSNNTYAACVDKDRRPCVYNTDLGMRCSDVDPSYVQSCQNTPTGGFWQTSQFCTNGKLCRAARFDSVVCYAPDAPTCAGLTTPVCIDAHHVEFCDGNPTDGYVTVVNDCPTACTTSPTGSTSCS